MTMQDVRSHLATLDKDTLADMLVDQAMEDDRLRQRLLMKVARKGPKGLDVATYRRAIDEAVDAGNFMDYRDACDYARGIEEAKASLQSLREAALRLQEGGVGYYPGSGFFHIDSGRFRTW